MEFYWNIPIKKPKLVFLFGMFIFIFLLRPSFLLPSEGLTLRYLYVARTSTIPRSPLIFLYLGGREFGSVLHSHFVCIAVATAPSARTSPTPHPNHHHTLHVFLLFHVLRLSTFLLIWFWSPSWHYAPYTIFIYWWLLEHTLYFIAVGHLRF